MNASVEGEGHERGVATRSSGEREAGEGSKGRCTHAHTPTAYTRTHTYAPIASDGRAIRSGEAAAEVRPRHASERVCRGTGLLRRQDRVRVDSPRRVKVILSISFIYSRQSLGAILKKLRVSDLVVREWAGLVVDTGMGVGEGGGGGLYATRGRYGFVGMPLSHQ